MAEGAPLLREYTLIAYRGFESLLLRHYRIAVSLNYSWMDKPKVTQCEVFSSIVEYQMAFDGIRRKENEALKAFISKNKI